MHIKKSTYSVTKESQVFWEQPIKAPKLQRNVQIFLEEILLFQYSDMNEELRNEAIEFCVTACEKFSTNNEVRIFIFDLRLCEVSWFRHCYFKGAFGYLSCALVCFHLTLSSFLDTGRFMYDWSVAR